VTAPRVLFVGGRAPHHAQRSGYAEIARRQVPSAVRASRCRWIPGRLAARLAAHAGIRSYGAEGVRFEASVMLSMLVRRRRLVHFLSGEAHYRYAGALAGFRGNRILCTYHQPPSILERLLPSRGHLRRLSGAIALASNQVPFLSDALGPEKVFLVPHGVDTEYFRPPEARPATRTCLCVGHWLRDFGTLREAIAILRRREPSVRVEVVAAPGQARELEGLDGVEVVGGIPDDDLLARYRSAALFLLPLRGAAANNALLEAMACGLPAVVTDTGGIRDYADEACARLVPLGDAGRMAEEALALLSDAAQREALGRAARERALAFDWGAIVRKTAEVHAALAPRS
jgi:glycosyltransferase involved in cell wall biosynthesis